MLQQNEYQMDHMVKVVELHLHKKNVYICNAIIANIVMLDNVFTVLSIDAKRKITARISV